MCAFFPSVLFFVKVGGERPFLVDLELTHTVADVRRIAALRFPRLALQQILFKGKVLEDADALETCDIEKEVTLQVVARAREDAAVGDVPPVHDLAQHAYAAANTDALPPAPPVFRRNVTDAALQFGDIVLVRLCGARAITRTAYFSDTSDAYAELELLSAPVPGGGGGAQSYVSRVAPKTRAPVWEQSFAFWFNASTVSQLAPPVLRIQLRNQDAFGADSRLGCVDVRVDLLPRDQTSDEWMPIVAGSGELHVMLSRSPLSSAPLRDTLLRMIAQRHELSASLLASHSVTLAQFVGDSPFELSSAPNVSNLLPPDALSMVRMPSSSTARRQREPAVETAGHGIDVHNNVALRHLLSVLAARRLSMDNEATVARVSKILHSQRALALRHGAPPSRFLFLCNPGAAPTHALLARVRAVCGPNELKCWRVCSSVGVAVLAFRTAEAAVAVLLQMQYTRVADGEVDDDDTPVFRVGFLPKSVAAVALQHNASSAAAVSRDEALAAFLFRGLARPRAACVALVCVSATTASRLAAHASSSSDAGDAKLSETWAPLAPALAAGSSVNNDFKSVGHHASALVVDDERLVVLQSLGAPTDEAIEFNARLVECRVTVDKSDASCALRVSRTTDAASVCITFYSRHERDAWYALLTAQPVVAPVPAAEAATFKCTTCAATVPLADFFELDQTLPASANAAAAAALQCTGCAADVLQARIANVQAADIYAHASEQDIHDLLSHAQLEAHMQRATEATLSANKALVACPTCHVKFEVTHHSWASKQVYRAVERGIDNREVSKAAQEHFLRNRFLCRNDACSTSFCRECSARPYHLGFDCVGYRFYQRAPKCRYCECALFSHNRIAAHLYDPAAPPPPPPNVEPEPKNFKATGTWSFLARHDAWASVKHMSLVRFGSDAHGWVQKVIVRTNANQFVANTDPLVRAHASWFEGAVAENGGTLELCSAWENLDPKPADVVIDEEKFAAEAKGPRVCSGDECVALYALACTHRHARCGHECGGVRGETVHLPCMEEACADCDADDEQHDGSSASSSSSFSPPPIELKSAGDDLCGICYTSELLKEPCYALRCGHVFHRRCLHTRLTPPETGRLTFAHLRCPMCAAPTECDNADVDRLLEPHRRMHRRVMDAAWEQIEIDDLRADKRVTEKNSSYHNDVLKYALDTLNFYRCNRCKQPYFGGRRECDAPADAAPAGHNPAEYVCTPCMNSSSQRSCDVPGHQDSLVWKCRYCCSPAVWFCGGTVHYCDPCHSGGYQRPHPCPPNGQDKCPLGLPAGHAQGEELMLGCGLCSEELHLAAKHKSRVSLVSPASAHSRILQRLVECVEHAPSASQSGGAAATASSAESLDAFDERGGETYLGHRCNRRARRLTSGAYACAECGGAPDGSALPPLCVRAPHVLIDVGEHSHHPDGHTSVPRLPTGVLDWLCTAGGTQPWFDAKRLDLAAIDCSALTAESHTAAQLLWCTASFDLLNAASTARRLPSHVPSLMFRLVAREQMTISFKLPPGLALVPSAYALRSAGAGITYPQNWVLEGSICGTLWHTLDVHRRDKILATPQCVCVFPVRSAAWRADDVAAASSPALASEEARLASLGALTQLRWRAAGASAADGAIDLSVALSGIEFFGALVAYRVADANADDDQAAPPPVSQRLPTPSDVGHGGASLAAAATWADIEKLELQRRQRLDAVDVWTWDVRAGANLDGAVAFSNQNTSIKHVRNTSYTVRASKPLADFGADSAAAASLAASSASATIQEPRLRARRAALMNPKHRFHNNSDDSDSDDSVRSNSIRFGRVARNYDSDLSVDDDRGIIVDEWDDASAPVPAAPSLVAPDKGASWRDFDASDEPESPPDASGASAAASVAATSSTVSRARVARQCYFEIAIEYLPVVHGQPLVLRVGVSTKPLAQAFDNSTWGQPAYNTQFVCYGNDGKRYQHMSAVAYDAGRTYGEPMAVGDVIGVLVHRQSGQVEFFRNGYSQGVAFTLNLADATTPVYPCVCVSGIDTAVRLLRSQAAYDVACARRERVRAQTRALLGAAAAAQYESAWAARSVPVFHVAPSVQKFGAACAFEVSERDGSGPGCFTYAHDATRSPFSVARTLNSFAAGQSHVVVLRVDEIAAPLVDAATRRQQANAGVAPDELGHYLQSTSLIVGVCAASDALPPHLQHLALPSFDDERSIGFDLRALVWLHKQRRIPARTDQGVKSDAASATLTTSPDAFGTLIPGDVVSITLAFDAVAPELQIRVNEALVARLAHTQCRALAKLVRSGVHVCVAAGVRLKVTLLASK